MEASRNWKIPSQVRPSPSTFSSTFTSPRLSDHSRSRDSQFPNMGKFKKPRNTNRTDPTGKPTKPPSDPRILPVLQDLQSVELKKRSTAASLIANLVEDEATRKQLLRGQIVRILFKRTLCDSNIETRTAGWGILRKLALEEGADFCVHLYRQGVLKPLEENVKSVGYARFSYSAYSKSK